MGAVRSRTLTAEEKQAIERQEKMFALLGGAGLVCVVLGGLYQFSQSAIAYQKRMAKPREAWE